MILINLLPHREEKRRQRRRNFFIGLGLAALAGALAALAWMLVLQRMTEAQQERNQFLRTEIGKLDAQIKDIATLKADIEGLKARQAAVEDLQTNRNVPVYLLDELARLTPEGVYLSAVRQQDSQIQVTGLAQTNERVSEFLRNTQNQSRWLQQVDLVEIKAVNVSPTGTAPANAAAAARDARRLYEFGLKMQIKLPSAVAAAAAASAPLAASAGSAPAAASAPAGGAAAANKG